MLSAIMWIRLHSVIIRVRDFDRGRQEIGRLLGRPAGWLGVDGVDGTPIALFFLANTTLEVRGPVPSGCAGGTGENPARGETPAKSLTEGGEGLGGIRLEWDPGGSEEAPSRETRCPPGELRVEAAEMEPARATGTDGSPDRSWSVLRLEPARSRSIPIEIVSEEERGGPVPPRTKVDPRGSQVEALDHVVLLSPDLEASRRLYELDLGLRLALDRSFPERGVRLLFFRVGGTTVEIGGRLDVGPGPVPGPGSGSEADAGDRFGGLAWRVADVDAARARLEADGFEVSSIREGHKPGTRVCTVRSPVHGVPTLLIEPVS